MRRIEKIKFFSSNNTGKMFFSLIAGVKRGIDRFGLPNRSFPIFTRSSVDGL